MISMEVKKTFKEDIINSINMMMMFLMQKTYLICSLDLVIKELIIEGGNKSLEGREQI